MNNAGVSKSIFVVAEIYYDNGLTLRVLPIYAILRQPLSPDLSQKGQGPRYPVDEDQN
jgi:hypothetical protein